MINKQAEINKRMRTYLACRGVLRIKTASPIDEASAIEYGNNILGKAYRNRQYAADNAAAVRGGRREGYRHGAGLRNAGNAIGEAIGNANGNLGGGSLEDFGGRVGEILGKGVRDFGEGARSIAAGGGAYLQNLGRGAWQGAKGIGSGLASAGNKLYDYANNSIGDFVRGFGDNPGSSALGLAGAAGLGYLGATAGNNWADYLGLAQDSGWRKALKWGLGGLSGLGGFYMGRGLGKAFGRGFYGTDDGDGDIPPSGGGNLLPGPPEQKLLTYEGPEGQDDYKKKNVGGKKKMKVRTITDNADPQFRKGTQVVNIDQYKEKNSAYNNLFGKSSRYTGTRAGISQAPDRVLDSIFTRYKNG